MTLLSTRRAVFIAFILSLSLIQKGMIASKLAVYRVMKLMSVSISVLY